MVLRKAFLVLTVTLAALSCTREKPTDEPTPTPTSGNVPPPEYCAQAPNDQLCSFLPHDVIVTLDNGYSALGAVQQRPFDNFSWQSFIALNWPANPDGTPSQGPIGSQPDAQRVWEFYADPLEVFGVKTATGLEAHPPAC